MKMEKGQEGVPAKAINADDLPGMAEFLAKAVPDWLRERHEDAEQLFWLLARHLRAGTLQNNPDLIEYLQEFEIAPPDRKAGTFTPVSRPLAAFAPAMFAQGI